MTIDLLPFLVFTAVTSFTPGPNNISSMSFGMSLGYKKIRNYIFGIGLGIFMLMLCCAFFTLGLANLAPLIIEYLKYFGAAYILYLAYKTLKVNYQSKDNLAVQPRFTDGLLLQLLNPKAVFYGMTVYSTFFSELVQKKLFLFLSALFLAIITFSVVSLWALSGAAIKHFMTNPKMKTAFTYIMALGLVYAAFAIVVG